MAPQIAIAKYRAADQSARIGHDYFIDTPGQAS